MFQKGIFFVICVFLAAAAIGEAEYYTWIDENGVTNYAQRNPPGHNAEFISSLRSSGYQRDSRRPQGQRQERANTESTTSDESGSDISIDAEREAVAQQIAKAKRSNCGMGKRNLAKLEAFQKIRVRDENGEEKLLSDEEKAQRIDETRQIIRENCTG